LTGLCFESPNDTTHVLIKCNFKTMPPTQQIPENQTEQLIATGHLAAGSQNGIISTSPLGSCVAVVAYDKTLKTGGIVHTMLPGKSPAKNKGGGKQICRKRY